ncbi:MAG TPA: ABC transporter substrate-binding protein [Methylomirabilota bacterium]
MNRRRFMVTSLAGAFLSPRAAAAQPAAKMYRIALFHVGLDHVPPSLEGLRDGLKTLGYEEDKNLRLDFRNLPDEAAARTTAAEFARTRPDLVVAFENQTIRAAHGTITDIPVVFLHVTDPVTPGLVKSLARPGGNMTGFIALGNAPLKEVQLFKEIVPSLQRMLVLSDPEDPGAPQFRREVRQAASALKITLIEREARTANDLERMFESVSRSNTDGVFIASLNLRVKFHSLILRLAASREVPVAGHRKEWVQAGALFSYAENIREVGRVAAARYVDKILKGAKPADLPIEAYERPELVINLKTAKALRLKIPPAVLVRADEVIE